MVDTRITPGEIVANISGEVEFMDPVSEIHLTHLVNVDLVHVDQRCREHHHVQQLHWLNQLPQHWNIYF